MWYYRTKAGVIGPVSGEEMVRLIDAGEIVETTLVRRDGQSDWSEAWQTDRAGYLRAMSSVDSNYSIDGAYAGQVASVWSRIGAHLLDALFLGILSSILGWVVGLVVNFSDGYTISGMVKFTVAYSLILVFLYYGIPSGSKQQATFGMQILNIKFVRATGGKVGIIRGGLRPLAMTLSIIPFYLGFIAALFNEQRITLHDLICGTRVVRA